MVWFWTLNWRRGKPSRPRSPGRQYKWCVFFFRKWTQMSLIHSSFPVGAETGIKLLSNAREWEKNRQDCQCTERSKRQTLAREQKRMFPFIRSQREKLSVAPVDFWCKKDQTAWNVCTASYFTEVCIITILWFTDRRNLHINARIFSHPSFESCTDKRVGFQDAHWDVHFNLPICCQSENYSRRRGTEPEIQANGQVACFKIHSSDTTQLLL